MLKKNTGVYSVIVRTGTGTVGATTEEEGTVYKYHFCNTSDFLFFALNQIKN